MITDDLSSFESAFVKSKFPGVPFETEEMLDSLHGQNEESQETPSKEKLPGLPPKTGDDDLDVIGSEEGFAGMFLDPTTLMPSISPDPLPEPQGSLG